MSNYHKCCMCGDLFPGVGGICPACARAMAREPIEVKWLNEKTEPKKEGEDAKNEEH